MTLIEQLLSAPIGNRDLDVFVGQAAGADVEAHAPYTTIQASALALMGLVLPEWFCAIEGEPDSEAATVHLTRKADVGLMRHGRAPGTVTARASTPALSLCAAILMAKGATDA